MVQWVIYSPLQLFIILDYLKHISVLHSNLLKALIQVYVIFLPLKGLQDMTNYY